MTNGKFVISLDFEIYWGVRDAVKLENYKLHLLGVRTVIPRLLDIFNRYRINATFATVGFLFFDQKEELLNNLPLRKPQYRNRFLSPYTQHLQTVDANESSDPYHFAASLIQLIHNSGQEIGSHTFSHYYCLAKGQTAEDFREDLIFAKKIAATKNIELESFVFPRNQYHREYLKVCKELGFTSYRGNERSWLFSSKTQDGGTFFRRPFRLLDAYINLSGHNCYSLGAIQREEPFNIPSSRFLRPYTKKLAAFEPLRLKRIKASMEYAAKKGLVYHLWWHPHNFGINIPENFSFLEQILSHFQKLKDQFQFESVSMRQLSTELKEQKWGRQDY